MTRAYRATAFRLAPALFCSAAAVLAVAIGLRTGARAEPAGAMPEATFQPPPDSAIPDDEFGRQVKLGAAIFDDPAAHAAPYVGNALRCSNCHLDAGRLAGSAPMWAAYVSYPAFRSKNGHVNTFAERLQGCFRYSMNGVAPPLGDPVLVALESYSYFLATGLPTGKPGPGRGYAKVAQPPLPPDFARGAAVYGEKCAGCHGTGGAGQMAEGRQVIPALWGPQSYNWGAGMALINNAAAFIHANMPLGQGGSLTPQQAWDVARYVDGQIRPQDPRFNGDVAATRAKFHDSKFSMYGKDVDGHPLGDPAVTPPAGTVPGARQPGAGTSAAPSSAPEPPAE